MKNKYWTEPEQLDKTTWIVKQFDENKKEIKTENFKSKQDAWTFLKTINIYVDDKLVYSGV
jgi:hypothetical protein